MQTPLEVRWCDAAAAQQATARAPGCYGVVLARGRRAGAYAMAPRRAVSREGSCGGVGVEESPIDSLIFSLSLQFAAPIRRHVSSSYRLARSPAPPVRRWRAASLAMFEWQPYLAFEEEEAKLLRQERELLNGPSPWM